MARTILVVDDERTLRETLAESLEQEGFAVVQAADGREAVDAFRRHHPDLILLDLMLPEISGTEVCRVIRAESGVPILMLTAKSAEVDKVVGLELGADDYVTKPFSFRELLARIRALLRRSEAQVQGSEPETVDLGQVRVDLAGRRVEDFYYLSRASLVKEKLCRALAGLFSRNGISGPSGVTGRTILAGRAGGSP